ncbi:LAME_0E13234g1_1 [Lachancea meyersii CBS 8951]|uniref:LAME_0E13234g1_1 n=1 Tax=Lachancea meyersii CBS 8951 TaxID=1266667 RepID=A0A1G4JM61_9SACH|nr:LAME_0E13234g1_1 [Lachancea meyersii CBS 8951]
MVLKEKQYLLENAWSACEACCSPAPGYTRIKHCCSDNFEARQAITTLRARVSFNSFGFLLLFLRSLLWLPSVFRYFRFGFKNPLRPTTHTRFLLSPSLEIIPTSIPSFAQLVMQNILVTPTKAHGDVTNAVAHTFKPSLLGSTPKAQVLRKALDAPPLKLGHKTGYRFPPRSGTLSAAFDSPSKPSRYSSRLNSPESIYATVLEKSPELTSDDDTLSDDSNLSANSMISPTDLSPVDDVAGSPPLAKDFLLSSALLHSSLLSDGTLHEGPGLQTAPKKADVLPLFSNGPKKLQQYSTIAKPLIRRNSRQKVENIKSILKRPTSPESLNYLVTTANGSLVNATIFATEINSCTGKVPLPANKWERVTIPVNIEMRDQLLQNRAKLLGHEDDTDFDGRKSSEIETETMGGSLGKHEDAAIIRGYDFDIEAPIPNFTGEKCVTKLDKERKLRWNEEF